MEGNTIRKCPICGRPVSAEQKTCTVCNSPINGKTCPYCGKWVDADATTCPTCDYSFTKKQRSMAKTNYPEELTSLVEEFLTDGIISAKERQVLLNKAEKLGIDVDEFDLYIDAQQQKVDQVADAAVRKAKGKACPYCGKPVPQLAEQCPHCGQFITAEASEELEEILDELEDALVDFKAGRDIDRNKAIVEKYSRKARMYYSSHPKIKAILAEVDKEISAVESAAKKQALIRGTIKNKWFWCVVPMVIGLIFLFIAFLIAKPDEGGSPGAAFGLGAIGIFAILGGVYGLMGAAGWGDK